MRAAAKYVAGRWTSVIWKTQFAGSACGKEKTARVPSTVNTSITMLTARNAGLVVSQRSLVVPAKKLLDKCGAERQSAAAVHGEHQAMLAAARDGARGEQNDRTIDGSWEELENGETSQAG